VNDLSRRGFLKSTAATGTGLIVAVSISSFASAAQAELSPIASWVRITPEGIVKLYTSVQEMGQGAWCAHARILADELEVDWDKVLVEQAPLEPLFAIWAPEHVTGGSGSIRSMFVKLRTAGAAAREMLVQTAATRWMVPVNECVARAGTVHHEPTGRSVAYANLAEDTAKLPVPAKPKLKARDEWRLIGKDMARRKDIPSKVDGTAVYATDVMLPGMLTATIMQAPAFGAKLIAVDPAPAMKIVGVRHVVPLRNISVTTHGRTDEIPDAVIVIADRFWQAKKGMEALAPKWSEPTKHRVYADTAALYADLDKAIASDEVVLPGEWNAAADKDARKTKLIADSKAALAAAERTVDATYRLPLLAHAQMEPMSAVAHVTAKGVALWAGTQRATADQQTLAALIGVDPDKVIVHTLFSGGAFGRRYKCDFAMQAALASRAAGKPVKLIWTREEDMRQGWYRAASLARCQGALDRANKIGAMRVDMASSNASYGDSLFAHGDRNDMIYDLGALLISSPNVSSAVPCGPWRSVPNTVSAFAAESFVDEMAYAAGQDPIAFRLSMLDRHPRAARALQAVAGKAKWNEPVENGRGRGVALWSSFDSYVAQIVEVEMVGEDQFRVVRVDCVIDPGTAVHPDGIRAQGEGSIIMALTAAAMGEINIKEGKVVEGNYDDYPMLLLAQTPTIDIQILETPDAPRLGGAGEPMTPPTAPALTNAIFAASGKRLRTLPLSKAGLSYA
jgi:isoquinoline 1-oxidoreductase subunit beta